MTTFLRIMLVSAGIAGSSALAAASTVENGIRQNGTHLNGFQLNGVKQNGNRINGFQLNGVKFNALSLNGDKPQSLAVNALADKSITENAIMTNGATKPGGEPVQGLFVIGVELPSR